MGIIHAACNEFEIALRRGARKLPHAMTALVVPGDPRFPTGSRGDQAMLAAIAKEVPLRHPGIRLRVLTEGWEPGEQEVIAMGFKPVGAWNQENDGLVMRRILAGTDLLLFLGADVMDGCYDIASSIKRWKLAEIAQDLGANPVILGCSFCETPHPLVTEAIRSIKIDFPLNFRDEYSLRRFQAMRPDKGRLVADIAFLMEAEQDCGAEICRAMAWVDAQRALGRETFGFNINPHLFAAPQGSASLERLVEVLADLLESHIQSHQASVVLLPHDFRPYAKDTWCMDLVWEKLTPATQQFALRVQDQPTAGEIKRLVCSLDFLITGRMHLAVAALGSTVAVGAITYQGKFEGLMAHFGLPITNLLTPAEACEPGRLRALIQRISADRAQLRAQMVSRLPAVIELARKSFT